MKSLTENQVRTLQRIRIVSSQQVARLHREYPGCNPSPWVNVDCLIRVHCQNRKAISALVKKGFLRERPSPCQQGPEVLAEDAPLS